MIQNFEPLIHHQYFDESWIQMNQQTATDDDLFNYLTPGSSQQKLDEFTKVEKQKQIRSDYICTNIKMIAPQVKNQKLEVQNNKDLKNIEFLDCLNIITLCLDNCPNIVLQKLPQKVKHLTITNSGLTKLDGIELLTQLETLNISNNSVISCEKIAGLKLLSIINVEGNQISDLYKLRQLPNLNYVKSNITKQKNPTNNTNELMQQMNNFFQLNEQLIYDAAMAKQYNNQVQNGQLVISENLQLNSFEFVQYINVVELLIIKCKNVQFERCPKSQTLQKLSIICCNLHDLTGIQTMLHLQELILCMNQITDFSVLAQLSSITRLNISSNNISDISAISKLQNLIDLDISCNLLSDLTGLEKLIQLKYLKINKNQIVNLNQLEQLLNIQHLNVSNNKIFSIISLSNMKQLSYLNISYNDIIQINVLNQLVQLQDIRLDMNFISDFQPLQNLKYFSCNWIQEQRIPTDENYMLCFNCKQHVIVNFLKQHEEKKALSEQKFSMMKKYQNQVIDNLLKIHDEGQMYNLLFADFLNIIDFEAKQCKTIDFNLHSKYIRKLKLNNCIFFENINGAQQQITGIYQMTQLTDLDLGFNSIININELAELSNLRRLNLQNNDISRIFALKDLNLTYINLTSNKIIFSENLQGKQAEIYLDNNFIIDNKLNNQTKPKQQDFQYMLGPNSTPEQAKELLDIFNYQEQMLKYQKYVQNKTLSINKDDKLCDFQFVSDLPINSLEITECKNILLSRKFAFKHLKVDTVQEAKLVKVPVNIVSLKINKCELMDLSGLEDIIQLESLDLKDNCIFSVQLLQTLVKLQYLCVENNYIYDLQILKSLPQYNANWLFGKQNEPSQELFNKYVNMMKFEMSQIEITRLKQDHTNEREKDANIRKQENNSVIEFKIKKTQLKIDIERKKREDDELIERHKRDETYRIQIEEEERIQKEQKIKNYYKNQECRIYINEKYNK
ncbi:leucine-rich_repeat domain-containing protein [Hexamita inflata]|uniref:Leucine-rich repeat domain-containing protein n=1 Tax=Hexamita inflata TaxID=28002 RepID=A0AA86RCK2_9EUKA|nr:leucine-rich repeat domain-containing protein [Hexamita inflata]